MPSKVNIFQPLLIAFPVKSSGRLGNSIVLIDKLNRAYPERSFIERGSQHDRLYTVESTVEVDLARINKVATC